jgi:uncharacterized protein (DUF2236 family)
VKQLWPVLRLAPARSVKVGTVGLLRPFLRERFGLRWSRRDAFDLRLMSAASRAASPLLPKSLMEDMGHRHLAWRSKQIAAGPLGTGADTPARKA